MKLKIKDPDTVALVGNVFLLLVMLGLCGVLYLLVVGQAGSFSLANYFHVTKEICQNEDFTCLFILRLVPLFPLAVLIYTVHFTYKTFFSKSAKKNKIRVVEFLPEGVLLAYAKPQPAIFLPYAQTQFYLTVTASMVRNKYGSFPAVNYCELTFLQGDQKLSCRHAMARPIPTLTQLIDQRNSFKKFDLSVAPLDFSSSHAAAANAIRKQLEDYRAYGLICRYNKAGRQTIFFLGCVFLLLGICGSVLLYQMEQGLLILAFSLFALVGAGFFYLWYKDHQIAKQLARFKGEK